MDGDRLVIHNASTRVPWHYAAVMRALSGMKQHKVHVIKERVGGGFGSKQDIPAGRSVRLGNLRDWRPVLFRYTREEEFIANTSRHEGKSPSNWARKDGRLTAVKMDFRAKLAPAEPLLTAIVTDRRCRCRYIHAKTSISCHHLLQQHLPKWCDQGYGAPKGNLAITMALAELAEQLQIDQLEIIERNRVHEGKELKILRYR